MKKMLLSAALLMAAFTVNAQEIGYIDPNLNGVTSDGVTLPAGTVLATTEHVTVTNVFEDTYKATGLKGDNISFNGEALATSDMGIQGSTNGPGAAASEGAYPTQGCIFRFTPTADGYIYLFHAASGNKNYVVFEEESARMPYVFSMENTSGDDVESGAAPATFSYDLSSIEGATYFDEIVSDYYVSPDFAILQAGEMATGTQYKTTGNGVIKFKVYANCRYDALATGSKMTLAAFAFDTTGDANVSTDANVLLENGQIPGGGGAGIEGVVIDEVNNADAPAYNIAGQRVNKNAKGIVIINGKKYINK